MAKTYRQFVAENRESITDEGREAYEVFSRAYVVGQALAQARAKRTLTQRALAEISGVQQSDISRIERGVVAPNASTFLRLIEALNGQLFIRLDETSEGLPQSEVEVSRLVSH